MNHCGSCTACCTVFSIYEAGLQKPAQRACPRLRRAGPFHGCSSYRDRPDVCRSFRCAWLAYGGSAPERPDRCGYVLGAADGVRGPYTGGVFELRAGACRGIWPQILRLARTQGLALEVHFADGSTVVLYPDGSEQVAQGA